MVYSLVKLLAAQLSLYLSFQIPTNTVDELHQGRGNAHSEQGIVIKGVDELVEVAEDS